MGKVTDIIKPGMITSTALSAVITDVEPRASIMRRNYLRYRADKRGVPILNRKLAIGNEYKINEKLNTNIIGIVTRTKTGYFGGNPVTISVDEEWIGGPEKKVIASDLIDRYRYRSSWDQLNTNTVKYNTVCGGCGRVMYAGEDGEAYVRKIDPWEVVLLDTTDPSNPPAALRVYTTRDLAPNGTWTEVKHCTYYDAQWVIEFVQTADGAWAAQDVKEHFFGACPLWIVPNNEEIQGDVEEVLALQDSYDTILSDLASEIQQLRLAYMYFKNITLDETIMRRAIQTGAFEISDKDETTKSEIGFISKNISIDPVKFAEQTIRDNMMTVTGTPNFNDQAFSGNPTGVAIGYKLVNLENRCIQAEQEFKRALDHEFRLLAHFYRIKRNIDIDPSAITYNFTRNLPKNLEAEANLLNLMYGKISDETLYNLLSFTDARVEKERLEQEGKYSVSLGEIDMDQLDDEDTAAHQSQATGEVKADTTGVGV